MAFSQHNLSPIHANIDYMVDMIKIKDQGPAKTLSIAIHRGPVWVSLTLTLEDRS